METLEKNVVFNKSIFIKTSPDVRLLDSDSDDGCTSTNPLVVSEIQQVCDSTPDSPGAGTSNNHDGLNSKPTASNSTWPLWARYVKLLILLICWMSCCYALITRNERIQMMHQVSVPPSEHVRGHFIAEYPVTNQLTILLQGALLPSYYGNLSKHWITVWIELVGLNFIPDNISEVIESYDIDSVQNISVEWRIPIVSSDLIGFVPEVQRKKVFQLKETPVPAMTDCRLRLKFRTNLHTVFPVTFAYNLLPINIEDGVIYGALLLLGLYLLIIFEIVHRTLAAMLASTMSVAILAALNARPSMKEIISWIDVETLLLLFSMMILVAIFSETGVFDYLAVLVFRITNGKTWPLVTTLCLCTATLSSVLDNVTTVLLMTPVTIRLCEVMELNPIPILMIMVIYSNIGGAITPIGDPPNVIIASNSAIINAGVTFTTFVIHMGLGVLISAIVIYIVLRIKFRDVSKLRSEEIQNLQHELSVWQRAAASMSSYSRHDDTIRDNLQKKMERLWIRIKNQMGNSNSVKPNGDRFKETLEELQRKYPIRDRVLLIKSGFILVIVISAFFLQSIPQFSRLGFGWTALLGVMLLLLLADRDNIEAILARVEWSTLLFFASVFILMEALSRLGLIDWIGQQTQAVIIQVDKEKQLAVAILLILWVSAAASAFVDNIPLTTMMIRIATVLSDDRELNIPLQPLVWALSFGACLGGNGTLFGSSANVICAGIAEQHGYKFNFTDFFKLGFPIMLSTMSVITIYLLIAHVVLEWNY